MFIYSLYTYYVSFTETNIPVRFIFVYFFFLVLVSYHCTFLSYLNILVQTIFTSL